MMRYTYLPYDIATNSAAVPPHQPGSVLLYSNTSIIMNLLCNNGSYIF